MLRRVPVSEIAIDEVEIAVAGLQVEPEIGKNLDIYVGARVLGGMVVGDGSMVGANCVVTRDVPAGSVVVPAPNRVIPRSFISKSSRAVPGQM